MNLLNGLSFVAPEFLTTEIRKGENHGIPQYSTKKIRFSTRMKALDLLNEASDALIRPVVRRVNIKVHVREVKPPPLPDPKLSAKIVSLLKLAAEREKEAEAMQCLK